MKLPASSDMLYRLSDAIQNSATAEGVPDPQAAAELRSLAAAAEVLEAMPEVVCLIGSTRFFATFAEANLKLTLAGKIVLSIGCDTKKDGDLSYTEEVKQGLDILHLWKILLCDRVICLNVGGYIGESTRREIGFAQLVGKPIQFIVAMPSVPVSYDVPREMTDALVLAAGAGMRRPADNRPPVGSAL